jgi:3-deoxy-D-manno-octulosonic-acid transferase
MQPSEDEGGDRSGGDVLFVRFAFGLGEPVVPLRRVELIGLRDGVCDEDAAAGAGELAADERRKVLLVIESCIDRAPAIAEVEGGEAVGAEADDGHPDGFEGLAGGGDIKDVLDTARNDRDGEASEGAEIGGDIQSGGVVLVDSADAARGEESDARGGGELHGGADGGRGVGSAVHERAEVAGVGLGNFACFEQELQLVIGHADGGHARDDADEGGDRALRPDDAAEIAVEVERGGGRDAVNEQGGLEGDGVARDSADEVWDGGGHGWIGVLGGMARRPQALYTLREVRACSSIGQSSRLTRGRFPVRPRARPLAVVMQHPACVAALVDDATAHDCLTAFAVPSSLFPDPCSPLPDPSSLMFSLALDAVYAVVAAATAPWWMRKARGGWSERFGRIEALPAKRRPRVLVHAVSVGEVNLTRPLLPLLADHAEVVLSVTTDTGMARARSLYERGGGNDSGTGPRVRVVRYPLDSSASVRRFMDAVDPDVVALVELELWPNFARACGARGVPIAVINGRLSARSFKRYHLGKVFIGRYFEQLAFAAVQDADYAARFRAMGVKDERLSIAGSMKWDAAETGTVAGAEELAREMGIDRSRPLVVGGSTAPGEHELLHAAVPADVQLLCAPRRPEWFDEAARVMTGCVRRSGATVKEAGEGREALAESKPNRFLLDTIGELRKAYALADVIVIGRSFGALYGSDPMEAAALGKPVVIGPAVADFQSVVETMERGGAIVRTTARELPRVLAELLADPARRAELGERARRCVLDNQGAAARHARLIIDLLKRAGEKRA